MTPRFVLIAAFIISIVWVPRPVAAAQTPLERAKALYQNALFEPALNQLDAIDATSSEAVEALEYRVLCLLALERSEDAERAAAALVLTDPGRRQLSDEFPPRFVSLFNETRTRLLPDVASRMFAAAREQYLQSRPVAARAQFEALLALTSDPVLSEAAQIPSMRVAAAGFLDLLRHTPAARAERTEPAEALVPPVAIRQTLPPWDQPDSQSVKRGVEGTLRVVIGPDGSVESARMEQQTHTSYDARLLEAARGWLYKPATLNGMPVEAEKVIDIRFDRTSALR